MDQRLRACILLVSSDGRPTETQERTLKTLETGPLAQDIEWSTSKWIAAESAVIKKEIRLACDQQNHQFVLTLGGIGWSVRDRVAESTLELLDHELPGLVELIRLTALQKSKLAALYRGRAGMRNSTLVLNLGNGEAAVIEALTAIKPLLPYIFEDRPNPWI